MAVKGKPPISPLVLASFPKPIQLPALPAIPTVWQPPSLPAPLAFQQTLATIGEFQRSLRTLTIAEPEWLANLRAFSTDFITTFGAFQREFDAAFRPLAPMMAAMARESARRRRLEDAGWLPHYTTPWAAISEAEIASEEIREIIDAYYRDHWPEVKADFLSRLESYDVDAEAKATFAEVLEVHEAGYFRCVARTLFPEIERVARADLHAGSLDVRIASQQRLREAAGELGVSEIEPGGIHALSLFSKLFDDLYAQARTPEAVAVREADPVPNRHATLHGLVAYNSRQSSVNALIMTDYIFQVISAVKRNLLTEAA